MNTPKETKMWEQLKAVICADCVHSLFVPVQKNGQVLDAAFLYSMGKPGVEWTRPFASVLLDSASGTLLEYRNAYISDFIESEEYPMTRKLDYSLPEGRSAKEQGALIHGLQEDYPQLKAAVFKASWSDSERALLASYKERFYQAVPGALVPFYTALSYEFFQRLDRA